MLDTLEYQYVTRDIEQLLGKDYGLITAIVGPRRSGKTTLIKKFLGDNKNVLFMNFDRLSDRERISSGQDSLIEWIGESSRTASLDDIPKPYTVIADEAQKAPGVFELIKILYDERPGAFRFFISGSSALELYGRSTETLAGRLRYLHLFPFSLREMMTARNILPPDRSFLLDLISGSATPEEVNRIEISFRSESDYIKRIIDAALIWGGMPAVFLKPDVDAKRIYLQSYKETYLERDVRSIPGIKDFQRYSNMLDLLADYDGGLIQLKELSKALGLSHQTMKKYLSVLSATYLHQLLRPFIKSTKRRIVKAPKSYFADLGILSYLKKLYDLDSLKKTGAIGARFESWVLSEINKTTYNHGSDIKVFYWRTSGGVEVDFVCSGKHIVPIEVKYTENISPRTISAIGSFRKNFDCPYGVIIYNGPYTYVERYKIFCIPAWLLF